MRYWDSSAVVPLLVEEEDSPAVRDLLRADDQVVTWWGTSVECISALARLERDGSLSEADVTAALRLLDPLRAAWHEVQPVDRVRETAERVLRVHPLRAADALQLGAALVVADHRPSTLPMVCRDARLTAAARREGFEVLDG